MTQLAARLLPTARGFLVLRSGNCQTVASNGGPFGQSNIGAPRIAPPPFRFSADIAYEPGHSSAPICCRFPYVGFIVGHHTLSPSDMRRPAA